MVTVTHRLGSIRDADAVAVLNNGQVAEVGDHDTLLGLQGAYWRLWGAQLLVRQGV
jgi:ABC-type multidrug transport system fused ATPase/permease subunit